MECNKVFINTTFLSIRLQLAHPFPCDNVRYRLSLAHLNHITTTLWEHCCKTKCAYLRGLPDYQSSPSRRWLPSETQAGGIRTMDTLDIKMTPTLGRLDKDRTRFHHIAQNGTQLKVMNCSILERSM